MGSSIFEIGVLSRRDRNTHVISTRHCLGNIIRFTERAIDMLEPLHKKWYDYCVKGTEYISF